MACDSFTWFFLFSVGLMFVAALLTRDNGRSPTGVTLRDVGPLPGQPDRIANWVLTRLTATAPRCGRTGVRESDIPSLEGYARQFEEAVEAIRLSQQGSRGRGDR
jgi:hypothetical protein